MSYSLGFSWSAGAVSGSAGATASPADAGSSVAADSVS